MFQLRKPLGYVQLTISTVAKTVVTATGGGAPPSGSVYALLTVEGAALRWRDDGTAPTSSVGMPMNPSDTMNYDVNGLAAVQFIRSGSSDSTVNISYYGQG